MSGEAVLCVNWTAQDELTLERREFPHVDFILRRPGEPLLEVAGTIDGLINYSATEPLGHAPETFTRCRIAVRAGVGFDNLDLVRWGARGVPVCNVPDYGTTEVADHAIALMLSLARGIATYQEALLHNQPWSYASAPLVRRLRGAVFGIVGLGRIGLATARRAAAFGMHVVFFDPYLSSGTDLAVGFERVATLHGLVAQADVLSVHTPLNAETRNLLNSDVLAAAKRGLIVVNTARGPIIDLDALTEALRLGRIGGAALDVLPVEPADPAHPLIVAWRAGEDWVRGRLVLSPHAAFYSPASEEDLRRKSVQTVLGLLQDGRLLNCVNATVLACSS